MGTQHRPQGTRHRVRGHGTDRWWHRTEQCPQLLPAHPGCPQAPVPQPPRVPTDGRRPPEQLMLGVTDGAGARCHWWGQHPVSPQEPVLGVTNRASAQCHCSSRCSVSPQELMLDVTSGTVARCHRRSQCSASPQEPFLGVTAAARSVCPLHGRDVAHGRSRPR